MFEQFDFRVTQGRYVKAAMDAIATFRPDGKTPAEVQAVIDAALTARTTFQTANSALNLARGELEESRLAAHAACVQVFPIMKSRYRADAGSLSAISRLPIEDKTVAQTIGRMEATSILWGQLPNPPGSATAFKAWDTMDKVAFDALLTTLKTKQTAFATVDQDYEIAQGNLHEALTTLEDFVTAALIQGRAQFVEGTAEREVIDAIPQEPAQQPPAQGAITVATSPAAGQAHLEYSAARATSYEVLQKAPGTTEFSVVAADVIVTSFDATGLAPGSYDYQILGRNSRGDGPVSETSTVVVL